MNELAQAIDNLPDQLRDTYEGDLEKKLRALFPHGHPDFIAMCIGEMQLHSDKNHDYAIEPRMRDMSVYSKLIPIIERAKR